MSLYPDDSLTLHTDLYQINMMQTYWELGRHNRNSVFEVFFRSMPFENGYAIFAGLERMVNYLNNLRFTETDISYLRDLDYPEDFLDYLSTASLYRYSPLCPRRRTRFCQRTFGSDRRTAG